jgi:hypothetical protein
MAAAVARAVARVDQGPVRRSASNGGSSKSTIPRAGGLAEVGERLAAIQDAGLVRHASERADDGVERSLSVAPMLRALLPHGNLRRGSTVAVAPGATSLVFALLAEASMVGSWCVAVGLPRLGLVAAAEAGMAIERLALVPHPGPEWASVVAALLDGVDIVVAAPQGPVSAQVASRLAARARQRGGVLVPVGRWPGADLTLEVIGGAWRGLERGRGRLRRREVEVVAHGRGAAARPRRARLWLPGSADVVTPAEWTRLQPVATEWKGPVATEWKGTERLSAERVGVERRRNSAALPLELAG